MTYEYDEIGQKHAVLDDGSAPLVFGTEPHFRFLLKHITHLIIKLQSQSIF